MSETRIYRPIDAWTPLSSTKGAVSKVGVQREARIINRPYYPKANPQYLNDIGTYDTRIENKWRKMAPRAGDFPATDRVAFNQACPPQFKDNKSYVVNLYSSEQAKPCSDLSKYQTFNQFSLLNAL